MRPPNVYSLNRALVRMSWHPQNLFNLFKRTFGERKNDSNFLRTNKTMFQQRFIAKQLVRAYHGDFIKEKSFRRWYLPRTIPNVRPRTMSGGDTSALAMWAKRADEAEKMDKLDEIADRRGLAPVGSLMFSEVERRIDVFIFRCCFAQSVYEARRLVIHGRVLLNGELHMNANTRLAPGDMVSVDPTAIKFLRRPQSHPSEKKLGAAAETEEEEKKEDAEDVTEETQVPRNPVPGQPWANRQNLTPFTLPEYAAPFIFIPPYIEVSFLTCSGVYVRHPTARPGYSEIPTPFDADGEVVRLAWEWYAKRRPRMRSRSQLAREPENRKSTDEYKQLSR